MCDMLSEQLQHEHRATIRRAKRRPVQTPEQRKQRTQLLDSLIYEVWDGKPVYYAGYQDVLAQTKTTDEIMSSSLMQGLLIARIIIQLAQTLDLKKYVVGTNGLGVRFEKSDWRACNIVIFERDDLTGQDLNKYASVPPKVVIEIDTKADFTQFGSDFDYYQKKTGQLLSFGVEKVIWIFTQSEKVWVAEPEKDWLIKNWTQPIEVLPDCSITLSELV